MRKTIIAFVALFLLAACGSTKPPQSKFERVSATAGLGLGLGLMVGAPVIGVAAAIVGAGFTDEDDINIGEPVWRWEMWNE